MTIKVIANEINTKSENYRFGDLQLIRKQIKGLSKRASSKIFTTETISDDGWAFHYGGRKELQFNIGLENEGLRYGIAFSLETSRSLPDLSILYPKILRLNSIIREKPNLFQNYQMWFWRNERSDIKGVVEINQELAQPNTFIFIGKLMDIENIDYDEVLKTFDDLLNIYIEVESVTELSILPTRQKRYEFNNKQKKLPKRSNYTSIEKEISIDIRHSYLQEKLFVKLQNKYGKENVGLENNIEGNRIDIVVRENDEYIFYEVKTASSAKACIRQAFGQLMEYSYWSGERIAKKIIVAGEFSLTKTDLQYLEYMNSEFMIPIEYETIEK